MLFRIFAILLTVSCLLLASPAFAQTPVPTPTPYPCSLKSDSPIRKEYETKFGPCPAGLDEIEQIFGNIISVIVGLGFVALLILVLWSGIKFITSGGEPKALQSARATFAWAILGVIFMAIAWMILLLIQNFTGIEVTVFNIKTLFPTPTPGP